MCPGLKFFCVLHVNNPKAVAAERSKKLLAEFKAAAVSEQLDLLKDLF